MESCHGSYVQRTNHRWAYETLQIPKPNTQELLFDWSIYFSVLHMIGWSKMDERSPDTKYLSSMYWDCLNVKWDLNIIPCFIPLLSFVEFNMSFYRVNKTICWGQYWFLRSIKTHIDWYKRLYNSFIR